MRPTERIKPYLEVIGELWVEYAPDMRLWQFLENAWVDWHTEDLNQWIIKIATFCKKDPVNYMLWWTRGKYADEPLEFKRLVTLDTDHLNAILTHIAEPEVICWVAVTNSGNRVLLEAVNQIINLRNLCKQKHLKI